MNSTKACRFLGFDVRTRLEANVFFVGGGGGHRFGLKWMFFFCLGGGVVCFEIGL